MRGIRFYQQTGKPPTDLAAEQVDMSAALADLLKKHRAGQAKKAVADGRGISEIVTVNQNGRYVYLDHFRARIWIKALAAADVRLHRMHDLRRFYASARLFKGDDLWVVSNQLGHFDTKVTERIYSHWIPNKRSRSQVDELESRLGLGG